MKDLLVFVADADIMAFMTSMLRRPEALGIRALTFDVIRHPQRDPGMVSTGPELARIEKASYEKALLIWDHHGSGRESTRSSLTAAEEVSRRMDSVTWAGRHMTVALMPELEQWLWHCEAALASHLGITQQDLQDRVGEYARGERISADHAKQDRPKELFEAIMLRQLRRTISPRDFE